MAGGLLPYGGKHRRTRLTATLADVRTLMQHLPVHRREPHYVAPSGR